MKYPMLHRVRNYSRLGLVALAVPLLFAGVGAAGAEKPHESGDAQDAPKYLTFQNVEVHLEYNATDDDAEAVITVDAGVGLSFVRVVAPNGRAVLSLTSRTTPNLGLTKIKSETPEPSLADVKTSFPAGVYRFVGRTVQGKTIQGSATLAHEMPDVPTISGPVGDAAGIALNGSVITWSNVPNVKLWNVELEQEDLQLVLLADVLAGETSFAVPNNWLFPDVDYVVGVSAVGLNGNRTIDEVILHTAP